MALQNCKGCGKLMGETPSGFCESCKVTNSEYSNLHRVRDYLYEYPNSVIQVVSTETGVSVAEISKFIREGSIREISITTEGGGKCACGASLEGAERICKGCREKNAKDTERVKKDLARKITPQEQPKAGGFFTKQS